MDATRISTGPAPAALRVPDATGPAEPAGIHRAGRVPAAMVAPPAIAPEGGRQAALMARVQAPPAAPSDPRVARLDALRVAGLVVPDAARTPDAPQRQALHERVSAECLAPPASRQP